MSATNWSLCPRCARVHATARDDALRIADKLYGKVPVQEYHATLEKARTITPTLEAETLREDYVICMENDGTFNVSYECYCEECGFHFTFKHKEKTSETKGGGA